MTDVPDAATVESVARSLRSISREVRSLGDVPLVRLDEDGVTPLSITLADELWLCALALDPAGSCQSAGTGEER